MARFTDFRDEPHLVERYDWAGPHLVGVYRNPPGSAAPDVVVAETLLVVGIEDDHTVTPFRDIESWSAPAKGADAPIALRLWDSTVTLLPVLGRDGRFQDAFEFCRFLRSATSLCRTGNRGFVAALLAVHWSLVSLRSALGGREAETKQSVRALEALLSTFADNEYAAPRKALEETSRQYDVLPRATLLFTLRLGGAAIDANDLMRIDALDASLVERAHRTILTAVAALLVEHSSGASAETIAALADGLEALPWDLVNGRGDRIESSLAHLCASNPGFGSRFRHASQQSAPASALSEAALVKALFEAVPELVDPDHLREEGFTFAVFGELARQTLQWMTEDTDAIVDRVFAYVNQCAASEDSHVRTVLQTGFFEVLADDVALRAKTLPYLSPRARELYVETLEFFWGPNAVAALGLKSNPVQD